MYLHKDGEEDHDHGGGDEHGLLWDVVGVEQQGQTEGDASAQPSVRHDELVDGRQADDTSLVHHKRQEHHTCGGYEDICSLFILNGGIKYQNI